MTNESEVKSNSKAGNSGEDKMALVLPFTKIEFGQFVSSLLGKPQTIEKSFSGRFEITSEDIENTFLLVDQRVKQQNVATLVQFMVKIVYDDNSSVSLNSIEDFRHYREIKPHVSVAAHLNWTYLIRFQDKEVPEKQQIEMSISTSHASESIEVDTGYVRVWHPVYYYFGEHIHIRISHTARTWGVDIESLLTNHIKSLMRKQNRLERLICKYNWLIGLLLGVVFFGLTVAGAFICTKRVIKAQQSLAEPFLESPMDSQAAVAERVNFLIEGAASGTWALYFFLLAGFMIVFFIIAIIIGVLIAGFADNRPRSFLLLTEKSKEKCNEWHRSQKRDWLRLIVAMPVSILSSIIASGIFSIICKRWIH